LITENMLATYEQTRQIFAARLRAGIIQEIDLRRIEAEIAVNTANLHLLQNGLVQAEGVLAVLLGRSPRLIMETSFAPDMELTQITLPPDVPDQAPSNLLTRRPDIRAAEGQLIAANARIGAARAAFFPGITLTANGGYASSELDSLFMSPANLWSFVGNLTQPLFQGGRLLAREAMAAAQYRQMLANYELTVQQAFREVRESLINNHQRREITRYRRQQVEALARSLTLANRQYEQGSIGLMDLLDVRRNLLRSQLELAESQGNQLNAVVLLCKSLGGGWLEDRGFVLDQPPQADQETVE
jgi:multidrug efflux system outer membrane protein